MKNKSGQLDRATPETDAAYKYWPSENAELVDADFARNLERERDEAREVVQNIVRAGKVGCYWQSYAIAFLEKLEVVEMIDRP